MRRLLGVKPEIVVRQILLPTGKTMKEDDIRDAILLCAQHQGWNLFKATLLAAIQQHADRLPAPDGKPGADQRDLGYQKGLSRAYRLMCEAEVPKKETEDDDE
jgi:hypothetical protein